MLEPFSRALIELYDSAETVALKDYPAEVIRLVGRLVGFDGAVLGMGDSSGPDPQNLLIHNAFVHCRDPAILADYAKVSAVDPMTQQFLAGLPQPLAHSVDAIDASQCMGELRAFHRSHELRHLLLFGKAGRDEDPARWLVLYRGTGNAFDEQARLHLKALWPHIERGLSINRSHFMQRQRAKHQHKGVALISSSGCIDAAEPIFRKLCALEWPAGIGRKIPEAVWKSWRRGLDYVGAKAKFKLHLQYDDFVVSEAHAIGPLDQLTPAERIVATRFAAGQSAKSIAQVLGISVNTVRSQLAHVYEKLDIHGKGELASHLLADRAH